MNAHTPQHTPTTSMDIHSMCMNEGSAHEEQMFICLNVHMLAHQPMLFIQQMSCLVTLWPLVQVAPISPPALCPHTSMHCALSLSHLTLGHKSMPMQCPCPCVVSPIPGASAVLLPASWLHCTICSSGPTICDLQ